MRLYGTLYSADDNMVRKIKQVVDRVADKVNSLTRLNTSQSWDTTG